METGFSRIGLSMTGLSVLFCPISREEVVDFADGYEISDFLSLADKHFNGCFFQSQYFHFIISNERRGGGSYALFLAAFSLWSVAEVVHEPAAGHQAALRYA